MARTRTTLRRIDPWSVLKFGFVANLVLLGIELLGAALMWVFIQRLGLIETICELASGVGFDECGVDGGALFDTLLLLGLLGVVIQTGIIVFVTFLANLIFDLTGGIVVTLEDGGPAGADEGRRRSTGGRLSKLRAGRDKSKDASTGGPDPIPKPEQSGSGTGATPTSSAPERTWPGDRLSEPDNTTTIEGGPGEGESLFDRR